MLHDLPPFIMGCPVFRFPSDALDDFQKANQALEESSVSAFERDVLTGVTSYKTKRATIKSYINDGAYIVAYPDERIYVQKRISAGTLTPSEVNQWRFDEPLPMSVSNIDSGYLHSKTIEHYDFYDGAYLTRDSFTYQHKDEQGYHFTVNVYYLEDEDAPALMGAMHILLDEFFNVKDVNMANVLTGDEYGAWINPHQPKPSGLKPR